MIFGNGDKNNIQTMNISMLRVICAELQAEMWHNWSKTKKSKVKIHAWYDQLEGCFIIL